ncbi:hypothetical protein J21TS7_62250 [Paenibacillus cineris]|uniref:Uncharacterized protein n=1 Tax=Paenibacillus cineris TaxID=237530 RepID=A0ABQ4LN11_9BACL|nr:hypothetical protein J21TS7_62250 [Paenibacillus cineris]
MEWEPIENPTRRQNDFKGLLRRLCPECLNVLENMETRPPPSDFEPQYGLGPAWALRSLRASFFLD